MPENQPISCKEASFLISKRQETSISPIEEEQVQEHLAMCVTCNLFNEQTNLLVDILNRKQLTPGDLDKLSPEARARIEKELGLE